MSCSQVNFSNPSVSSLGTNPIPLPLSCTVGQNGPQLTRFYPTPCLTNPGLPQSDYGFEMNNLTGTHISIPADDQVNGTQNTPNLYIEIATYEEPDTIVINAVSANQQITPLIFICNYSTDTVADPTNPHGKVRPYSDTVLQFTVPLPAGTTSLFVSVDENTPYNSGSPTYVGVWNLNEFHNGLYGIPTSGLGTDSSYNFRPQTLSLSQYNDQLDKNNPNYPNYCVGGP
jgi:hypothetical protein